MTTSYPQPVAEANAPRWFMGQLINVLVTNEQTLGQFSLTEFTMQPGTEPPVHKHEREDEMLYVKEGQIRFTLGDKVIDAGPGQVVFLPRMIPHGYQIMTPSATALVYLTPGQFANFFWELSDDAPEAVLPPTPQGPPPAEFLNRLVETAGCYGVQFM